MQYYIPIFFHFFAHLLPRPELEPLRVLEEEEPLVELLPLLLLEPDIEPVEVPLLLGRLTLLPLLPVRPLLEPEVASTRSPTRGVKVLASNPHL